MCSAPKIDTSSAAAAPDKPGQTAENLQLQERNQSGKASPTSARNRMTMRTDVSTQGGVGPRTIARM